MLTAARKRGLLTRRVISVLCIGSLAVQIGCYSYLPVQSTPPSVHERVSLTISDRGRVLLSDRMGASINRVEGRIVRMDSSNVVVDVSRVITIDGVASNWLGEEVSIPRDAVLAYQARPISKPRTFVLVAAVVGGLLSLVLGISLAVGGAGVPTPVDKTGGGAGQS
jgi:hypothetical protein